MTYQYVVLSLSCSVGSQLLQVAMYMFRAFSLGFRCTDRHWRRPFMPIVTVVFACSAVFWPYGIRASAVSQEVDDNNRVMRDRLVDGVLGRAQAIQTGTVRFTYTSGVDSDSPPRETSDGFVTKPLAGEGSDEPVEIIVTLAGTEWSRRFQGSSSTHINRDGFSLTFTEGRNPDDSIARNLLIEPPGGGIEENHNQEMWRRILRCGTIPLPQMETYIKRKKDAAVYAGEQQLGSHHCHVLEWLVDVHDFGEAFYYIPRDMTVIPKGAPTSQSAVLRLFVSEEMGYSIHRVEYCRSGHEAKFWYEGNDYREVTPGIFFPFQWQQRNESGADPIVSEFLVREFTGVNEEISQDGFSIAIPAGTRVRDDRPGRKSLFRTGEARTIRDVDELVKLERAHETGDTAGRGRWRTATILVSANLALLAAIAAIWGVRKWRRSV